MRKHSINTGRLWILNVKSQHEVDKVIVHVLFLPNWSRICIAHLQLSVRQLSGSCGLRRWTYLTYRCGKGTVLKPAHKHESTLSFESLIFICGCRYTGRKKERERVRCSHVTGHYRGNDQTNTGPLGAHTGATDTPRSPCIAAGPWTRDTYRGLFHLHQSTMGTHLSSHAPRSKAAVVMACCAAVLEMTRRSSTLLLRDFPPSSHWQRLHISKLANSAFLFFFFFYSALFHSGDTSLK